MFYKYIEQQLTDTLQAKQNIFSCREEIRNSYPEIFLPVFIRNLFKIGKCLEKIKKPNRKGKIERTKKKKIVEKN